MAFCRNCGAQIHDEAVVCVSCGVSVEPPKTAKADDKRSGGWAFLCYLIPVLGLILWLLWKDEYPLRAKSCAKGAIISVILGGVFTVIFMVAYFLGLSVLLQNPEALEVYSEDFYETIMIALR